MKILVYSFFHPQGADGATASCRALCAELRLLGHRVDVVTTDFGWSASDRDNPPAELKVFRSLFGHPLEFSPSLLIYFARHLTEYDVVWFRGMFSIGMVCGARIARARSIPFVLSPLGNFVPTWCNLRAAHRGLPKLLFFRAFVRSQLGRAARIVCASRGEINALQQHDVRPPLEICEIPNGIQADDFTGEVLLDGRLGFLASRRYFVTLGRLSPEKSLEFLIEIWPRVVRQNPDLCLVIAGSDVGHPGYADTLTKQVSALALGERVFLIGPVTGKDKTALLRKAIGLLFPSKRESFGNVVLEALACGRPVVASQGTPWSQLEEQSLGRWLPLNAEDWIRAIEQLARNTGGSESFERRAQAWVNANFSWRLAAERYQEVFYKAVKNLS